MGQTGSRGRLFAFITVVGVCVAGALGYAWHVVSRTDAAAAAAPPVPARPIAALPAAPVVATDSAAAATSTRAQVVFRSTALDANFGRIALVDLNAPGAPRFVGPLQCERVHFAAGTGICLEAKRRALTSYHVHLFDDKFAIRHTLPLAGPPSRARVSRDGTMAAFTVFISGHSYATPGFVTRTSVIDTASGRFIAEDLERFTVLRDGAPFKSADFNFWGYTFARDGRRFYATLGTAGKVFLVEGDLAAQRMRVVRDGVECPSLSPDETRVAFKRRIAGDAPGRFVWRLHVLELATGTETALSAETRNVDDQVEWLSDREIVYAMPKDGVASSAETNLWALGADGAGAPRLLLPLGFSPAVIR